MSLQSHSKLFSCNIHNAIRISPMALKIIDTPEFQRMRGIKQLGLCYLIYPAAVHTRFEHSIGVYHLAGKMLEKIQQLYPNYEYDIPEFGGKHKLTDKVAECIKIAGLCHDIGHGPFSHVFDDALLKGSTHPNRHHENRSCLIMEMLCKRELKNDLDQNDIKFIKSIICPGKEHRGVLYQIVANNLNGIDVDKFDYLARDTKNLGMNVNFNSDRLISEIIIDKNGNIAYPKHCTIDIYEMFHSRYMMHKKVYSHKTVKLLEQMLNDIFVKVDNIFGISKSIENMDDFCKLTDSSIFQYICTIISLPSFLSSNLTTKQFALIKEANEIYENIFSRNLYKQIAEIFNEYGAEKFLREFLDLFHQHYPDITLEKFAIYRTKIGFVSGNKADPFFTIYFYDKKENNNTFTLDKSQISGLMNDQFQETKWHLICKDRSIYPLVVSEFQKYLVLKVA